MKWIHVILGAAWVVGSAVFATSPSSGWWVLLGCGVATLWYVPIGTFVSLVILALLLTPQLRSLL